MSERTWSDQQIAIRDDVARGESRKVEAYAGTGKTETTIFAAESNPRRGVYFAFNNSTALDARPRFSARAPHVSVSTTHSYAMRVVGHLYRNRLQRGPWEMRSAMRNRYLERLNRVAASIADADRLLYAALDVLRNFAQSGDFEIGQVHLPDSLTSAPAQDDAEAALAVARHAWEDIANPAGTLPVSHDDYLKIFQIQGHRIKADVIYLDEAQDANGVIVAMLQAQRDSQVVVLGDEHQAIYSWRGAVNAMRAFDFPVIPLTTSWRFGPEIAQVANLVLRSKQARWPLVGGGRPGKVVLAGSSPPTAVLCRSNAGMVDVVIEQLNAGRQVGVVGGVDRLTSMIGAAYDLWSGKRSDNPAFRTFANWEDLVSAAGTSQGGSYRPVVRLVEQHQFGVPDLVQRLRTSTVVESEADVLISTVHQFKGRQSGVVRLGSDFPPFATEPTTEHPHRAWGIVEEEANLAYVALTRAQEEEQIGPYYAVFRSSMEIMNSLLKTSDVPVAAPATSDIVSSSVAPVNP